MSNEMWRIINLPRRVWPDQKLAELAEQMTEVLKTPRGTMKLRPKQALALHDAAVYGGGFFPLGVGLGKTIISLMVAHVMGAKRPLLVTPATLRKKTEKDRKKLSAHWHIPTNIPIISYEMLGRVQSSGALDSYKPDLIIADEVHKLKNKKAAVTRRVHRWMTAHPETKFVGMSGTIMRRSIYDFAHLLRWALKDNAPIPKTDAELEQWAQALDERIDLDSRYEPGALLEFCSEEERLLPPLAAARRGFQRRLTETPGVVATSSTDDSVDCSIYINAVPYKVKSVTENHFATLRDAWERPDGKPFEQGGEVWACAKQLATGLHYEWRPPAPDDWMEARRAWSKFVRGILSYSRTLDSPLAVIQAIDAGKIKDPNRVLEKWRAVRHTYKHDTIGVWHDDTVLNLCLEWMKTPGIVWVEHILFAEELAKRSGCPYFSAGGFTSDGLYIEEGDPTRSIIASVKANKEGKNIQDKWSRNLVVSPPDGAEEWQQLIGRTHRTGQTADEVTVDVLLGCAEHANAWRRAVSGAEAIRDTVGAESKLLIADVTWPSESEIAAFPGPRWGLQDSSATMSTNAL